jgi:hypothetical protein
MWVAGSRLEYGERVAGGREMCAGDQGSCVLGLLWTSGRHRRGVSQRFEGRIGKLNRGPAGRLSAGVFHSRHIAARRRSRTIKEEPSGFDY